MAVVVLLLCFRFTIAGVVEVAVVAADSGFKVQGCQNTRWEFV